MSDEFDEWGDDPFGGDMDFDDDFDKPNNKGFIKSFATGFLSGIVSKSVGDTDAKIDTLKMVLPNTWLGAFGSMQQLNARRKEVMEEIKAGSFQAVQDLQYLAKRAAGALSKGTPNKISGGLYKFAERDFSDWEKKDYSGDTQDRMEGVTAEEIKEAISSEDANSMLERETAEGVGERTISMMSEIGGRQIGGVNALNQGQVRGNQLLEQLLDYQRRVKSRNDAMQLNILARTYLTNAKYYKFMEVSQHRVIGELQLIAKTSKLSDYEKTSNSQAAKKRLRDEFFGTVKNKFGGISDFIQERLGKDAREGTVGAVSDILGTLRMAGEMTEGNSINMGDMLGNAAGGMFVKALPWIVKSDKGQEYLNKFKKLFPGLATWSEDAYKRIEDLGNVATYVTGNAEGLVNTLARHYNGGHAYEEVDSYDEYLSLIPEGQKPISKVQWHLLNGAKNAVNKGIKTVLEDTWNSTGTRYSLQARTLADSHEHALWTRRSDRTLNEIIPQWLSQIHLSLEMGRTGNDTLKPMAYDYVKGRFITHEQKHANTLNQVLDHRQFGPQAEAANRFVQNLDSDDVLSTEAKQTLAYELLRDTDKEQGFSPFNYLKLEEDKGLSPKIAAEIKRLMKSQFDLTDDHINDFFTGTDGNRAVKLGYLPTEKARKKVNELSDAANSLSNFMPDLAAKIDIHKGSGSYDSLKETGIIHTDEYGRDDIDMDLIHKTMKEYIKDPTRKPTVVPEQPKAATAPLRHPGAHATPTPAVHENPTQAAPVGPERAIKVEGMDSVVKSLAGFGDLKSTLATLAKSGHPAAAQALNIQPLNKGMEDLNAQVLKLVTLASGRNDILTRMLNNQPIDKKLSAEDDKELKAEKRSIIERLKATSFKDIFNKGVDKILDHEPLILGGLLGGLATLAVHNPKAAALLAGGAAITVGYAKLHAMTTARTALDSEDLYEEGVSIPILEAWKLRRGDYHDATRNFVINAWSDITGSVRDIFEKVTIGARRLAGKLFTADNKEVFLKGLSRIRDMLIKAFKFVDPFGRAIALKDKLVTRFYQMDVYKEGEDSPSLSGKSFAAGAYYKRNKAGALVVISGWNEIDGPVYGRDGLVIITQDEFDRGLKTSMGVSITKLTAASKHIGQFGLDILKKIKERTAPVLTSAKDAVAGVFTADYSPIVSSIDRVYALLLKHWGFTHEQVDPYVANPPPAPEPEEPHKPVPPPGPITPKGPATPKAAGSPKAAPATPKAASKAAPKAAPHKATVAPKAQAKPKPVVVPPPYTAPVAKPEVVPPQATIAKVKGKPKVIIPQAKVEVPPLKPHKNSKQNKTPKQPKQPKPDAPTVPHDPHVIPKEEIERREKESTSPKEGQKHTFTSALKEKIKVHIDTLKEKNAKFRLNSSTDQILHAKQKKDNKVKDAIIDIDKKMGSAEESTKEKKKTQGLFGLLIGGIGGITSALLSISTFVSKVMWAPIKLFGTFASVGIKALPMMVTGIAAIAKGIFTLIKTRSLSQAGGDFMDTINRGRGNARARAKRKIAGRTAAGRFGKAGKGLGAAMLIGGVADAMAGAGVIDQDGAIHKTMEYAGDATLAYTGYQAVAGVAKAAGTALGVDVGAVATAGVGIARTVALTALEASWGVLLPALSNPYVLAGAAIAVAGYGIYRYVNRGKDKQIELRMVQYGVHTVDCDLAKKIFQIEETLSNHVVIGNGNASISKDAPLQECLKLFITDPNSKRQAGDVFTWFNGRFKPVFLTYMACLDAVKMKSLKEYDEAKTGDVYKIAKQSHQTLAAVMPYPYSIVAHIDDDTPIMGERQTVIKVNNLLEELKTFIDRKTGSDNDIVIEMPRGSEALVREKATLEQQLAGPKGSFGEGIVAQLQGSAKAVNRLTEVDNQLKQLNSTYKVTSAVITQIYIKDLLPDDHAVDTMTGIRLACYGNDADLTWRVEAVLKLERYCEPLFTINGDDVDFKGQIGDLFGLFKDSFRLDNSDGDMWSLWFRDRFVPVMKNYVMLLKSYRRGNPGVVWKTLSTTARYEISKALIETKVTISESLIIPIWNVRASPFKDSFSPGKPSRVDRMLQLLGEASTVAKLKDPEAEAGKTNVKSWAAEISPHKTGGGFTEKQANVQDASKAKSANDVALGGQFGTSATKGAGTGNTFNGGGSYVAPPTKYGYAPINGDSDTSHLDLSGVKPAEGNDHGVKVPQKLAEQLIVREMLKQGFTDPRAIAEMLALTNYETGGYSKTVENMKYSTPELLVKTFKEVTNLAQAKQLVEAGEVAIANTVYGGGKGHSLGNVEPGDGWKYRGRGFVELTGRAEYAKIGKQLGIDLVNKPELASTDPNVMAAVAVNFYKNSKRLQSITQSGDFGKAAPGLNGGNALPGMPKRFALYTDYLKQLQSGTLKTDGSDTTGGATPEGGSPATPASGAGPTAPAGSGGGAASGAASGGGSPMIGGGRTPAMGTAPGGGSVNSDAFGAPPGTGAASGAGDGTTAVPGAEQSLVGGGPGLNNGGLRLKSSESTAGGKSHPGIIRLAQLIQTKVQNFRYFSSLNDAFHHAKKPNSKHAKGLAIDFTLTNGINGSDAAIAVVNEILKTAGMTSKEVLVINEYRNASAGATGGHVHTQFASDEAADKFAKAAGAGQPTGQDTTTGGTVSPKDDTPATPPDTSTTPTAAMTAASTDTPTASAGDGGGGTGPTGMGGGPSTPGGPPDAGGGTAPQGAAGPVGTSAAQVATAPAARVSAVASAPSAPPAATQADPNGTMDKLAAAMQTSGNAHTTLLSAIHDQLVLFNQNSAPKQPSVSVG